MHCLMEMLSCHENAWNEALQLLHHPRGTACTEHIGKREKRMRSRTACIRKRTSGCSHAAFMKSDRDDPVLALKALLSLAFEHPKG